MTAQHPSSYDDVPYTSLPFAQTHPDRVAALATLFDVAPPSLERCCVLELGCASAGNLIPMALTMPHAQFVGVDLSDVQIRDGQSVVAALGLRNVDLRAMSIADVDESFGMFDFIIAHGVYSWVPDDIQQKILAVCARQLTANGIAFVSYNTLPGWRMRGTVRDLMRYHASQFVEPGARAAHARGVLEFVAKSASATSAGYETMLAAELETLRGQPDDYLLHEFLEDTNEPLYFHQFMDRAAKQNLQYLADADFGTMIASNFPPDVARTLVQIAPGVIRQEQYMDFLRNRTFRQTLLVRDTAPVNRKIAPERMRTLGVSGALQPESTSSALQTNESVLFLGANGARVRTVNAVTKAAAIVLAARWPHAIVFAELLREALSLLASDGGSRDMPAAAEATLASEMLRWFGAGLVQLHGRPSPFASSPGDRPHASALARLQARRDLRVTNLRHEAVHLDADLARLIQMLDGTRDRNDIDRIALEWAAANAAATGTKLPADRSRFVRDYVAQALQRLAKSALLVEGE